MFEFEPSGVSKDAGEPFRFTSSIGVLAVRDGKIVQWRDVMNFLSVQPRPPVSRRRSPSSSPADGWRRRPKRRDPCA